MKNEVNHILRNTLICLLIPLLFCGGCEPKEENAIKNTEWPVYLGGTGSDQYSSLHQINKDNLNKLKVAWSYASGTTDPNNRSQIQCNPLIIDGVLFGTSPGLSLFAIDAETGEKKWEFDPRNYAGYSSHVNRGICYWQNDKEKRLFYTAGSNLFGIDAVSGSLIKSFGKNGLVSLKTGLGDRSKDSYVVARSPGIVYKDLLIMGSTVSETMGAASGHIRAFNVKTGALEWIFNTIPQPGEVGYETWPEEAYTYAGGANNWAGMSLDVERGIVYCPTGSAAYDFWGGNRIGENLFANCVLALDAKTGERIWHFQTVHHDIWDKDLPAPPNLIKVRRDGEIIDALAQITKQGYIFLFDRETGKPLFEIEEVPVPVSDLKGESTWPTQPIPKFPPPLVPQVFDANMATNIDSVSNAYVRNILANLKTGNLYMPPSTQGTIILPGFDGGAEWGGAAADAEKGIIYVNSNNMPWIHMMVPIDHENEKTAGRGRISYLKHCAICHGQEQEGDPAGTFPSLQNIQSKYNEQDMKEIVLHGKGFMPSFKHVNKSDLAAIIAYIREEPSGYAHIPVSTKSEGDDVPYTHTGYNRFFDDNGYPAVKPPWGLLTAVDMNIGKILWEVPLGEYQELSDKGIPKTGTENYGGPLLTGGGVIFIGASKDEYFRIFDKDSGEELWKYKLPAGGYATPSTYMINGKQYVVIACGGGKMGSPSGNQYIAFALED